MFQILTDLFIPKMLHSKYSNDQNNLRNLLIEARKSQKITQQELSIRLDKTETYISNYENGKSELSVIEFVEVCDSLDINPLTLLKGLESVTGKLEKNVQIEIQSTNNILDAWEINSKELSILIEQNPSLRGMVLGYVAELKFTEMWLKNKSVTAFYKNDDHNRKGKGDRVITYKGNEYIVEVKSLQTNTVRRTENGWKGLSQVDGSDRREITFTDGSKLNTTLLLRGEFDILAVNVFAFENKWKFVFAKNSDLPTSTFRKYTEAQQQSLIKSLVEVTYPPLPPFVEDPYLILEKLHKEKTQLKI
jgi:transcriptional regulator with XRE-family HTH domain